MIYVVIICIVWMAIILKYCFWGDDEKRDAFIPLTDVKFIDTRKEMRGIAEDTVVSFNYRLVNIGQHDLRIGYINPDCTCTKCYAIDSVVAPGDTTVIVMKFDTKRKLGFHKLNTVVKLNTPIRLYKISAIVGVIDKDSTQKNRKGRIRETETGIC